MRFEEAVAAVANRDAIDWMESARHHIRSTVLEHSLSVAYMAYALSSALRIGDPCACAMAGFLHDLYMYDRADPPGRPFAFEHPEAALRSASKLFPWLPGNVRNAIVSHMFPLSKHVPACAEAWLVSFADKLRSPLDRLGAPMPKRAQSVRKYLRETLDKSVEIWYHIDGKSGPDDIARPAA